MPNDNIERAIKRGTGEGSEAQHFDEIVYEGYAPGGVAVIVEAATDNENRTAAEMRRIFTKNNGNLANERKRFLHVPQKGANHRHRGRPSTRSECSNLPWKPGRRS